MPAPAQWHSVATLNDSQKSGDVMVATGHEPVPASANTSELNANKPLTNNPLNNFFINHTPYVLDKKLIYRISKQTAKLLHMFFTYKKNFNYRVPPTVNAEILSVGCPTPTGIDCPSLPQTPTPKSRPKS